MPKAKRTEPRCINCMNYRRISKRRGVCELLTQVTMEEQQFIDARTNEAPETSAMRVVVPSHCLCLQYQGKD